MMVVMLPKNIDTTIIAPKVEVDGATKTAIFNRVLYD